MKLKVQLSPNKENYLVNISKDCGHCQKKTLLTGGKKSEKTLVLRVKVTCSVDPSIHYNLLLCSPKGNIRLQDL